MTGIRRALDRDLDRGERWARCAVWAAAWFVFGVFVCDAVWVVLG